MTYEERFDLLLSDRKFRSAIDNLKNTWGFNQRKYQSIEDLIKDEHAMGQMSKVSPGFYKKENLWPYRVEAFGHLLKLTNSHMGDFLDDITDIINRFNLPHRCGDMILDYALYGKIKKVYPRIWIGVKINNLQRGQTGEIILNIAPDATIRDIKRVWPKVKSMQSHWNHGDKKTQKLRRKDIIEKIMKPALSGQKPKLMELQEAIVGSQFYKIGQGAQFKKAGVTARAIVRSYRSRYRKKLKRHTR